MLDDDDPSDDDFIHLALATIHASAIELARVKEVALASGDAETITGAVFRASGKSSSQHSWRRLPPVRHPAPSPSRSTRGSTGGRSCI